MLRIGPSGNSTTFYATGRKNTYEAPAWLKDEGLNAFEYSFGRGINIREASARKIGEEMAKYDIQISAHAPYYINFANPDDEMIEKSFGYIKRSIQAINYMGGKRVIVHVGACQGRDRTEPVLRCVRKLEQLLDILEAEGYADYIICPETMGKYSQIGTIEEVLLFCTLSDKMVPCFDFGHINALTQGSLKTSDDYRRIIDRSYEVLGEYKTNNMHVHFSKIQYGSSGEIRHLDFSDTVYGPEFEPLANVIQDYRMTPVLICESKDIMSDDAKIMKNILQNLV